MKRKMQALFISGLSWTCALVGNDSPTYPLFSGIVEAVDFNKNHPELCDSISDELWEVGQLALSSSPGFVPFFVFLKQYYHIDTAIETGTYHGGSTAFFSALYGEVHTAEIIYDYYSIAKERLQGFTNVHCHLGFSQEVLRNVLPHLSHKPIVFYLDAHWQAYWPLLDELDAISRTHKDNCIIVIDDIRVPGRPEIPYDHYNNEECSYEYVQGQLEKIFTEYDFFYLLSEYDRSPGEVPNRGKLVVLPRSWNQ